MENQNILRIVLSLAIIAAFFLPLYNETVYGSSVSALSVVTEGYKSISGASSLPASELALRACLVVVLVCIVFILITSLLKKRTTVLLNLIPLISIIAFIIISMTGAKENMGQVFQSFGTGFYIMFLSSFLLPFSSIAVPTPTNN